jgi:hypothetical protein
MAVVLYKVGCGKYRRRSSGEQKVASGVRKNPMPAMVVESHPSKDEGWGSLISSADNGSN